MDEELEQLLKQALARYEAMTPAEQAAMWQAQRESYVRAEMEFGSDEDEREWVRRNMP